MDRGLVRVECLGQAHNTDVPGQGSNAGVEYSNHEATAQVELNLGGLTRQSNEKADKQIKMVDLQFVDFP